MNSDELARKFRALANAHRIEIFTYLGAECFPGMPSTENEMRTTVGDLAARLDIAPSTVSHHLRELREAGLIRMRRRGQNVECWVEPAVLREMSGFFEQWLPSEMH